MKLVIALLSFGLFFSTSLRAAEQDTVTQEILALAQIKDQAHQIAQFAINEIENRKEALTSAEYDQLSTRIGRAFDETQIYKSMERHFTSKYDAQLSPLWLETLKSPAMKKITALESASTDPANFSRLNEFAQNMQTKPPAQTRLDLVIKLDKVTRATDLAVASQIAVTKVILQTINPQLPSNKQMTPQQLDKLLDALKLQLEGELRQFSAITHLFTYQTLSDDELAQHVAHYETSQGQWMINTNYEAIMQALTEATSRVSEQTAQHAAPPTIELSTVSTMLTTAANDVVTNASAHGLNTNTL